MLLAEHNYLEKTLLTLISNFPNPFSKRYGGSCYLMRVFSIKEKMLYSLKKNHRYLLKVMLFACLNIVIKFTFLLCQQNWVLSKCKVYDVYI